MNWWPAPRVQMPSPERRIPCKFEHLRICPWKKISSSRRCTRERSPLSNYSRDGILFIDGDPGLFSVILSLLRTNRLPSNAAKFDVQDLFREARFYGLDQVLMASRPNLRLRSRLKDRLRHWEITDFQRSDTSTWETPIKIWTDVDDKGSSKIFSTVARMATWILSSLAKAKRSAAVWGSLEESKVEAPILVPLRWRTVKPLNGVTLASKRPSLTAYCHVRSTGRKVTARSTHS